MFLVFNKIAFIVTMILQDHFIYDYQKKRRNIFSEYTVFLYKHILYKNMAFIVGNGGNRTVEIVHISSVSSKNEMYCTVYCGRKHLLLTIFCKIISIPAYCVVCII